MKAYRLTENTPTAQRIHRWLKILFLAGEFNTVRNDRLADELSLTLLRLLRSLRAMRNQTSRLVQNRMSISSMRPFLDRLVV